MPITFHKKNSAFTLIELMITTSISAIMLITISSLLISFLNSSYKIRVSRELRETGTNAMTTMITQLRSSRDMVSSCPNGATTTSSIQFIDQNNVVTTFLENNDQIAATSTLGTSYLTNKLTNVSDRMRNLSFTCYNLGNGPRYIAIKFTLQSSDSTSKNVSSAILDFSSGVTLRN